MSFREVLVNIYNIMDPRLVAFINGIRMKKGYQEWCQHPQGQANVRDKLQGWHGAFEGHRCVVIGNGPSINRMDLSCLKDEYTFGMNRIYLKFEEWGFETDFLACVNDTVLDQFRDDFLKLELPKFFNWRHGKHFADDPNSLLLHSKVGIKPNGDIVEGLFNSGFTVTNACLEIAYFMGFSEVVLIGVDHSYKHEKGHGGKTIVAEGDDQNHFHKDYFGKGVKWQLPNLSASEFAYQRMRDLYEKDGRRIIDATLDGKLKVFEKDEFANCLMNSEMKNKSDGGPVLKLSFPQND